MENTDTVWKNAPDKIELAANEVHVWRINLAAPPDALQRARQVLTDEERTKAQRFYFEKDRHHWSIARGTLRILLGKYLQTAPQAIRFRTNDYGKPYLAYPQPEVPFYFNISHSQDLALCAFTRGREIGVDVEYKRENINYDELARYSFSFYEQAKLLPLPVTQKYHAFFQCWTRKEAYIKARGMGLSLPLDLFEVSFLPDEPPALLASREDPQEVERWTMRNLTPGPGYAGALIVEGTDWHLQNWQWNDHTYYKSPI